MSTTPSDILQRLPIVSLQLNRIVPIFQLSLGTFGNIMNILIFTRRSLRTNPCALYFLSLSTNNLFILYIALLTRYLSSGWKIDPANSNDILCKLRIFFVYSSLCLTQWFVVLASIDRFFCSFHSARYRQLSSLRSARKIIFSLVSIVFLAHFHTLIWWTVDYIGTNLYCNIFTLDYEIVFQVFFLIFSCLLPPVLMTIFGMLTIFNIKKLHKQVVPHVNIANEHGRSSKDRQLIRMLLIQVLITILCTVPFAGVNVNDLIVKNIELSQETWLIKSSVDNICRIILYFNPLHGFFIYTLSGQIFRNEMKCMIKENINCISQKLGLRRDSIGHVPRQQNQIPLSNMA